MAASLYLGVVVRLTAKIPHIVPIKPRYCNRSFSADRDSTHTVLSVTLPPYQIPPLSSNRYDTPYIPPSNRPHGGYLAGVFALVARQTDYVTEKVYNGFQAGTLPIYWGAENVDAFVPEGSIVKVRREDL